MPPSRDVREDGGFRWGAAGLALVLVALVIAYTLSAYAECDGSLVRGVIGWECVGP